MDPGPAALGGGGGFKIAGEAALDFAGVAGSAAGRGLGDLLIGAFGGDAARAAYVIHGRLDWLGRPERSWPGRPAEKAALAAGHPLIRVGRGLCSRTQRPVAAGSACG